MKILKFIAKIGSLSILLFVLFIIYASITDYRPKSTETIFTSEIPDTIDANKPLSLMIWNIGYCGLSDDMDFFYDGGKQVRTSEINVLRNCKFIKSTLQNNDSLDFILLQEVDLHSRRSYYLNELDTFIQSLPYFKSFFGKNYDVTFIPTPAKNPLGKVKSGLVSFSKFNPKDVVRYTFPGNYSWPVKLFMLDRCFLVQRFPTSNHKEFVLVNTHNSAYDDGSLKKQQMEYLKAFLLNEFDQGNYIIVGGDWNQNPPEIDDADIRKNSPTKQFLLNPITKDYLPQNWNWVYDTQTPSNRYLNAPYEKGKTITPIIDFYLMSPNIFPEHIKTQDFEFKHSDHQPVISNVRLD